MLTNTHCSTQGYDETPTPLGTLYELSECGERLCEHGCCPSCQPEHECATENDEEMPDEWWRSVLAAAAAEVLS